MHNVYSEGTSVLHYELFISYIYPAAKPSIHLRKWPEASAEKIMLDILARKEYLFTSAIGYFLTRLLMLCEQLRSI